MIGEIISAASGYFGGQDSGMNNPGHAPANEAASTQKVKNKNKNRVGGAKLVIKNSGGKGRGKKGSNKAKPAPALAPDTGGVSDLFGPGLPMWLVITAMFLIVVLVVGAIALGS